MEESVVVIAVMSVVGCLLCILACCLTANKEQTVTPPSGQGADHSNVGVATTVILISADAGWGGGGCGGGGGGEGGGGCGGGGGC